MDLQTLSVESANIARRESAWQRLHRNWSVRAGGCALLLMILVAVLVREAVRVVRARPAAKHGAVLE